MQEKMYVYLAVSQWDLQNTRLLSLINNLPEERLMAEIAPGKNTGHYVLGHLVAVSDAMLPVLGFGEKLFPELLEPFIKTPYHAGLTQPTIAELKAKLEQVNSRLSAGFETLSPSDWLGRHTSVSEEDFQKEPHRNKLNLLINRTNHIAYHLGQMVLLK